MKRVLYFLLARLGLARVDWVLTCGRRFLRVNGIYVLMEGTHAWDTILHNPRSSANHLKVDGERLKALAEGRLYS